MTVPLYCCRCCSNHSIDSASKWFVGSSNNNISGSVSSNRHNATRLLSPPDKYLIGDSPGGQRRASIARSNLLSKFQASFASNKSVRVPCLSMSLSISSSLIGSANFALISSYSLSKSTISCIPCWMISFTVKESSSSGSWAKYPIE
ncbi:hypothetical protein SDC9_177678 [bioreactor metagenome]|uniref:Uncharacterized protein n=1 Tax=bioreactor metagenome TaxID=1076179 RepID=A0A645GTX2_9ZZZZ